jgi:hypothetical protein
VNFDCIIKELKQKSRVFEDCFRMRALVHVSGSFDMALTPGANGRWLSPLSAKRSVCWDPMMDELYCRYSLEIV